MPPKMDTAPFLISDDGTTPASSASRAMATAAFDEYCEKTLHSPRPREPSNSFHTGDDDDLAEALRRSLGEACPHPDVGSPKKKARWNVPLAAEGTFLDGMDSSRGHPPLTPTEPSPGPDEEFHDPEAAEGDHPDGQGPGFTGLPAEPLPAVHPAAAPRDAPAVAADEGIKTPIPDMDIRTLQSEILAMFGSLSTKIHEDNMTIMNKMNTLETSFQEKIDLNAKKLENNIDKKHDLLSQNMTEKIQNVSEDMNALKMRLGALEQAMAAPANSPPSGSARTTAPSPPAADPVGPADPWRCYDFKNAAQNLGNLRKLDSGDSTTLTTTATTFVPRFIHLQGWAKYGDENTNISQDESRNLAALINERLPAQERALVIDVLASRFPNSRVSFRIKDGGENC